ATDGLSANQNYHWQAEALDSGNIASHWVSFDTNSDTPPADTDFRVPQANLSISKGQSATPAATCPTPLQSYLCVLAGRNVTYTLSASNAGPDTATNVKVTDTLPDG